MGYITTILPATDTDYFKDLMMLDLIYFVWVMFDKDLRLELGILSLGSLLSNYLILQDYNNYTNYIYEWYPFIMKQIFYGCIFTFVVFSFKEIKYALTNKRRFQ